jgi:hypothetical protein
MSPSAASLVDQFLDEPVPLSGTQAWRDWQARGRELSLEHAVPRFIEALKNDSEERQYAALLGLRFFCGFYAFGEGDGPERVYRLRAPSASTDEVIRPKYLPEPYTL